jgi:hypothetical protein
MSGRSHPRPPARPPARRPPGWQCSCTPVTARTTTAEVSMVVHLHAPDCPLPVDRRRPTVLRFRRRPPRAPT